MIRNQSGQVIGAQMVSATDGSAFTAQTTVYVTVDAGTQTLGSVGSGLCTHEGNGYHSYRPSQAETNGELIAFTFVGLGAIPQTIQVETISADLATVVAGASPLGTSTGQDLLDRMAIFHPELEITTGGKDVTRALLALNMAQDYMESVFALQPKILGDATGTVTQTANTETTTFPVGVLRLDKLQYLDPSTNLPVWDVDVRRGTGSHAPSALWPLSLNSSLTAGKPVGAFTNGRAIYWDPIPDTTNKLRWYGFQIASDITTSGAVAYPDICLTPLANLAVQILRTGLDDDTSSYVNFTEQLFAPVVKVLAGFIRDSAPSLVYRRVHTA